MSNDRSEVTEATRQAEAEEAHIAHGTQPDIGSPDAGSPDAGSKEPADDSPVDERVRRHYREMTELGANERGEGRVP
jgi:hypothetical protein